MNIFKDETMRDRLLLLFLRMCCGVFDYAVWYSLPLLVGLASALPIEYAGDDSPLDKVLLVVVVIYAAYWLSVFVGILWKGQTLSHFVFQLKVVDRWGSKPGAIKGFLLRMVIPYVFSIFAALSYDGWLLIFVVADHLAIFFGRHHCLHDCLSGTRVEFA